MVRDNASVFDALTTSGRNHYKSQDLRVAAMWKSARAAIDLQGS